MDKIRSPRQRAQLGLRLLPGSIVFDTPTLPLSVATRPRSFAPQPFVRFSNSDALKHGFMLAVNSVFLQFPRALIFVSEACFRFQFRALCR